MGLNRTVLNTPDQRGFSTAFAVESAFIVCPRDLSRVSRRSCRHAADPRSLSRCLRFLCLCVSALAAGRHQQKDRAGLATRVKTRGLSVSGPVRGIRSILAYRADPFRCSKCNCPKAHLCTQGYLADLLAVFQKKDRRPVGDTTDILSAT